MKKLIALFIAASMAYGAGSVTQGQTPQQLGQSDIWLLQFDWTGDSSSGSVPQIRAQGLAAISGYQPIGVQFIPGSPAPTTGYSVAILSAFVGSVAPAADILGGSGASLSATVPAYGSLASGITPLVGAVTLSVTGNSVASAKGTVQIFFQKPGLFAKRGGSGAGNIAAMGAVVAGCKFQAASSASGPPYSAVGSTDDCYAPALNGATLFSGGTAAGSGGVGFTVPDVAGPLALVVLPTTTVADQGSNKFFKIGSTVTCPMQTHPAYIGIPCVSSTWSAAGGANSTTIPLPMVADNTSAAIFGVWARTSGVTGSCDATTFVCAAGWTESTGNSTAVVAHTGIPQGWTSGTIGFTIQFEGGNTGGTVAHNLAVSCVNAAGISAFTSAQNFATQATTGFNYYQLTLSSVVMPSGCAAADNVIVRLQRSDTTGIEYFLGGSITFALP